jgi:hypothetical protein
MKSPESICGCCFFECDLDELCSSCEACETCCSCKTLVQLFPGCDSDEEQQAFKEAGEVIANKYRWLAYLLCGVIMVLPIISGAFMYLWVQGMGQ